MLIFVQFPAINVQFLDVSCSRLCIKTVLLSVSYEGLWFKFGVLGYTQIGLGNKKKTVLCLNNFK